jgi:hypothetical protein
VSIYERSNHPQLTRIGSETSHKALNAINELQLVPFLLSFLSNAPRLAPGPVAAAGAFACPQRGRRAAQPECLI